VEDRWHELSEFRSKKCQNIDIRIRDPAKSEIPMSKGSLKSQSHSCIGVSVSSVSRVGRIELLISRVAKSDRKSPDRGREGQR
jgi:hypothetical protein